MGKLFEATPFAQIRDRRDYNKYKNAAEPGTGQIGMTAMTDKQKRDKKLRDAVKTPMNQQKYS
jgi:hypothetical protein